MIKRIALVLFIGFAGLQVAEAQTKIGYANYQAIMDSLPEVRDVQLEIVDMIQKRTAALQPKADSLQQLYDEYTQIVNTLDEATRQAREADMDRRAGELDQLRQQGAAEVQQRRNALMAPIRTKVNMAIQEVASELDLDMVLNEAEAFGDTFIFYASSPNLNITAQVLEKLK